LTRFGPYDNFFKNNNNLSFTYAANTAALAMRFALLRWLFLFSGLSHRKTKNEFNLCVLCAFAVNKYTVQGISAAEW